MEQWPMQFPRNREQILRLAESQVNKSRRGVDALLKQDPANYWFLLFPFGVLFSPFSSLYFV